MIQPSNKFIYSALTVVEAGENLSGSKDIRTDTAIVTSAPFPLLQFSHLISRRRLLFVTFCI